MRVDSTPYRVVERMSLAEGAAFVAALSRYLSSPEGNLAREMGEPLEVRAEVANDSVTVLLSDGAYRAAAERFDPVPLAGFAPADRATRAPVVFGGARIPAWGAAEAEIVLRAIGSR
jgi:hypothetical protein